MKKRIWISALLLCVCVLALFSCKNRGDKNDQNQGADGNAYYTVVFEYNDLGLSVAEKIRDKLSSKGNVGFIAAYEPETAREIVVGNTEREISKKAYKNLEKINSEDDNVLRYLIYSDGTNLALAYDVDKYDTGAAANTVLEIFLNTLVSDGGDVNLKNGILSSGTVDIIEYQQKIDEVEVEKYWTELQNAIPKEYSEEITSALKSLYSIYSKDVVTWFANLYEPSICVCTGECKGTVNCGGGGYYYSNSARDTVGYLPDVESTRQALNFISASGLASSMGKESYVDFLPEEMKNQIITFIRGLQDENGYFYHPQWGKELTDGQISRRARDLNWATKTLTELGALPKYDTPNGLKGDGSAEKPVAALTSRLGGSAVSAVSFVVPTSSSYVAPHLKDDVSFKAYLNSLPIETESYEVGNELASQSGQIIARDADLKKAGADYSLAEIAIEWLNSKQNPETGTWDEKQDYHATNGLMKISCFYNDVGAYLPHADKAVTSALFSMTTDEDPYNVCCIYNNWFTIGNVIENIREHSGNSAAEEVAKVRALLYAQGAESIIASAQKLLLFKKLDGSFSYKQEYSSYTSQGMPVCEPYTNEGDVNATDICIEGTLNNIYKSLGLKAYMVPVLGKADAIKYLTILENLQPVIKDEVTVNVDYITFDDDYVGEVPVEVTSNLRSSLASLGVEKSPRGDGKILRFSSPADSGKANAITFNCATASQKCYVFESDLCIESADEGYVIQLTMGRCYMLAFRIVDGKLNLWDSSNTSSTARIETELGIAPKIGQWFNLKVEYYVGDDENVRIIVYYNGNPTAVSDNYYDNTASRVETGYGKPSSSYTGVTISTISSRSSVLLMDNVALYKSSKLYTMPVGKLYQNVDEVKSTENVFGFDTAENDTDFPEEITVSGSGVTITDYNLGKALSFVTSGRGSVLAPIARRGIGAKCNLYDFEMVIDENAPSGAYLDVKLRENNTGAKSVTAFRIIVKDGYAVVCDAPDGEITETYDSVKIPLGESVRVTFEYFEREDLTLISINGILCTASKAHSSYGKQYIPGNIELSVGGADATITVDNLRAEKLVRLLSDALKPSEDSTVHDFESTDFDAVLSGNASIDRIGTSNVVSIPSGGTLELPIEKNGVVTNSVYVTLDLAMLEEGENGVYYIAIADNAGLPIFAIGIQREENKILFHEYSVSGILAPTFFTENTQKQLKLTLKLYLEENEAQIFVGDECVAVSGVFYNDDALEREVGKVIISGVSGNSKLTVDNVSSELIYSIYEEKSEIFESYIDNSTKLTFDEAITNRIPSNITARYATSAKTRINEFLIYNVRSKALTFGTAAGGNDSLEITITERSHNYNKVVFESDIYTNFISCSSGKPQYHIFFETASGIAYQFRIVLENGKLTFRDHDNTSQGANVQSNISANEWFNLRIEIELGNSDSFKATCYVNNKKLYESNHYYGKGEGQNPYTSVERVRFYTMSAMTSDISFDNVVLAQAVKEIEPPKETESEILSVKGGANGIVVLMHDDGDLVSASILDSIYRKYSLRGNVSLIVDRVYDVETDTPMEAKVSAWNSLFESGRWQLTSHSKTHDFWGTDNSDGKITDEVVASQTILRNLFASQRVLTFAYPGFSAYEDTYSQDEIYGVAKELVSEHYVSGRYFGSEGAFDMSDVDWDFVIAESIGQSYLNQTLATIDSAAEGKMAVIFMHDVCQDTTSVPSQTVTYSHMDAIAQRISSYVKDGVIWNAFYEDAVMYLEELKTAKLTVNNTYGVISVSITDELPDDIYNYPLSVRIKVSEDWEAVKVVQGDATSYAVCKTVDGERVAIVDVVPNGVEAVVVSVSASEVPKDEEDSGDEELGGNIDFENSALGGDVAINGDASLSISGSNVDGFDKFVANDDTENKIYKVIAKNLGANAHVYVDRASSASEKGNYYIFSTKLYLDALLDGAMLPASNSFATLDFRINGTSDIFYTVNLRRIRINKDTPEESRGLVFTPKSDLNNYLNKDDVITYNTWVDLTVELYIDKDSGNAVAKIYLGENLIGSEMAAVNSSLIDSIPTRVDIKYLKNTSSAMYFDEVNFVRSETSFMGESDDDIDNEEEQEPDKETDPSTMDFEKCEIGDTSATSLNGTVNMSLSSTSDPNFKALIEASANGSDKHLTIENSSASNRHIRFDFDTTKGNSAGNTYTLKMKMFITDEGAVHDKNFADIDFRTTSGALLYTARMFWSIKDGVTTVSLRSNSKTDDYAEFVSGIPTNEWIEFEMVCYTYVNDNGENAVDSSIFVNGTMLGGHTGLTLSGATAAIAVDIDRFNIKTYKNVYSKFYIDDLLFVRTNEEKSDS